MMEKGNPKEGVRSACKRRLLLGGSLLCFLLIFLWGPQEAGSAGKYGRYDLAYVAADESLWQVWLANSEDETKTKLTRSSEDLRSPAWSPDGMNLAYATRSGSLFTQRLGENPVELPVRTVQNSEPAWSPDGQKIVYVSYTNPKAYKSELWIKQVAVQGKSPRAQKVNIPAGLVTFPFWSKDAITYSRLEKAGYSGVIENICRYDLQSGQERVLIGDGFDNIHPAWSPDGSLLAYASNREGNFDIWLWNPASDTFRQLTSDPSMDQHPTWSANGRTIAFTSSRSGESQVWLIDVETGDMRQIGYARKGSRDPSWRLGTRAQHR